MPGVSCCACSSSHFARGRDGVGNLESMRNFYQFLIVVLAALIAASAIFQIDRACVHVIDLSKAHVLILDNGKTETVFSFEPEIPVIKGFRYEMRAPRWLKFCPGKFGNQSATPTAIEFQSSIDQKVGTVTIPVGDCDQ
jgi:hypothetical protein